MELRIIVFLLLFFVSVPVFAQNAIVSRNYAANNTSIIKHSNNTPISTYDSEMIEHAISELKQKIKRNPYDYVLYAGLADLYLKKKSYIESFNVLSELYRVKSQTNKEVDLSLERLLSNYKSVNNKDGDLYINIALMTLYLNDNTAIDYSVKGLERSKNDELKDSLLKILYNSDINIQASISTCDKILMRNHNNISAMKIRAMNYEKNNQAEDAIKDYEVILTKSPEDETSRYRLYKLLSKSDNMNEKEMIKRLYSMIQPYREEDAYADITQMLLNHEDYGDAKVYAEILMKKYNKNPSSYILMSEIYKREGKVKDAYETLRQARDKADDNETAGRYNVMLAKLSDEPVKEAKNLINSGLYAQAIEVLESANPEALQVILTQAKANYFLGNKQKTFDLLNRAMSLYSDNTDVYCMFGDIYLQENDLETARSYIEQSLKLDKNNKSAQVVFDLINRKESSNYIKSITECIEEQNFPEAMRLVDEALSIDKKSADLYYYKSLIYISQNNYAASTATLYKCIELKRDYKDAYFYLGVAFDNLREKQNALRYYKKYLELTRNDTIGASEQISYAKARITKINSQ